MQLSFEIEILLLQAHSVAAFGGLVYKLGYNQRCYMMVLIETFLGTYLLHMQSFTKISVLCR